MRFLKWIGFAAALALAIACFFPWVFIESKNITLSGIEATGTSFGKPGYFHFLMTAFFLVFHFIPKVWAKRSNLVVVALNLAWAIRNYILISLCHMGECPVKKTAIYILIPASVVMLAAALFPDIDLSKNDTTGISEKK
ncbi:MAG TPA: hypothetical protein VG676_14670 [Chitinophagaceae bacterium]|jgi:hypothetical protein|nr:hypothetical protein [Chitinophagaceae bacterium]